MAFEISEAQIEKIVEQVLRSLPDASAPAAQWDATQYGGRKFIGIFESMEAAIEATAAGYKALREMTVEQREKIITEIRRHLSEGRGRNHGPPGRGRNRHGPGGA